MDMEVAGWSVALVPTDGDETALPPALAPGLSRRGGRDGTRTFLVPFPEIQRGFGWRPVDSRLRGGERG